MKEDKPDFGAILSEWEKKSSQDYEGILKEKGDKESQHTKQTISGLRAMIPQRTLDLHGLTADKARARTIGFLRECRRENLAKICIITGKGLHSQGTGVIRESVISCLKSSRIVREIQVPPERWGGSGALWVILKHS